MGYYSGFKGLIKKKKTGKERTLEQDPTLLVNDEKLKNPTNMANNFFIIIT
jgi:hypothetical protein